jgi:1,4-alpha-glucan branching enzyme
MIKREVKAGKVHLTFVLPQEQPTGRVSVVGDFNEWTPGRHTLVKRSNGTRSVKVTVDRGETYRFRYLGEQGHWFDDPEHALREGSDCVVEG